MLEGLRGEETISELCRREGIAHAMDYGTCWIGAFYEDRAKALLGVPDEVRIVALFPLGYPADDPAPRPRKPLEEIVAYEKWS